MFNLLSVTVQTYEGFGMPFELNWLGQFIKILIESFGSIGLGIIMFTLTLKLITLPLDIYQRVSMKKNSLKMEKMRPQLEKLQRQYANDKALYSQKMQALYKKEGYSMMSSCLPTIVTLVIFIIVIGQFSNYSRYTNLSMINNMAATYTAKIEQIVEADENGYFVTETDANGKKTYYLSNQLFEKDKFFKELRDDEGVTQTAIDEKNATYKSSDINACAQLLKKYNEQGYKYYLVSEKFIETDGVYSVNWETGWDVSLTEDEINERVTTGIVEYVYGQYRDEKLKKEARDAVAEFYRDENNKPSFLWVENIWVPDLPWKHPVVEELSQLDFYSQLDDSAKNKQAEYAEITAGLKEEKTEANGYLILVVLSIGVMLLSQIIMNKTQKAQLELQSVDGQAAQTSKMMTWMMPIMFGVFAFIYTASFSIYMIVSSLLSTSSTLIINAIVGKRFNKQIEEEKLNNDKRFKK